MTINTSYRKLSGRADKIVEMAVKTANDAINYALGKSGPHSFQPCRRCGHCCKEEICIIAEVLIDNPKRPCPALIKEKGGTYTCDMMINPTKYSKLLGSTEKDNRIAALSIRKVLAQGVGCGAPYNVKDFHNFDKFLDEIYEVEGAENA